MAYALLNKEYKIYNFLSNKDIKQYLEASDTEFDEVLKDSSRKWVSVATIVVDEHGQAKLEVE